MKQFYAFLLLSGLSFAAHGQLTLTGNNYTQHFDNIGSGLPQGFSVRTSATNTSLGTVAAFTTAPSAWNSTTGAFYNYASYDGMASNATTAVQNASTDRAMGVHQSSGFGDPGTAFCLQLTNTSSLADFVFSFKLQSLDNAAPRTVTWTVDYGFGAAPTNFLPVATSPATLITGGNPNFSSTNVTVNFGSLLNNQSQPVWIRIVMLTASGGTGTRPATGIDDLSLVYTGATPCTPPASQASTPVFNTVAANTFDLGWTPVAGTNSLVVVKEAGAVSGTPLNGVAYTANTSFGSGSTLGAGEYVVYAGSGSSVQVTNLAPGTAYHVSIFSYNTVDNCYNTTSPATASTTTSCAVPATPVSVINASPAVTSASVSWSGGDGTHSLVKLNTVNNFTAPVDGVVYTANSTYTGGEQVVFSGTGNTANINGLTANTLYFVTVYTYSNCAGVPDYLNTGNSVQSFTTFGSGIPAGYYDAAAGLSCAPLKTALFNIINTGLNRRSYGDLWDQYLISDIHQSDYSGSNVIWDIYSDKPGPGNNPYEYTPGTNQCGTYSVEGDCYNREHSFPQSWFGGGTSMGPGTDYHHIFPTDGKVNGTRDSHIYGETSSTSNVSQNGSKLGPSNVPGISATVFEPINEYKGDVARAFLYMVTMYQNSMAAWENDDVDGDRAMDGTTWPSVELPYLKLMLKWHNQDAVSLKEIIRNDGGYSFQGNRNPFVDHPEYVNEIWSTSCGLLLPVDLTSFTARYNANNTVQLNWTIERADGFSHFDVERSVNGGPFIKTGEVAWVNGVKDYAYNDNVTSFVGIVQYRLRLVDQNMVYKYSNIVSVNLTGPDGIMQLYPNPAKDKLRITFRQAPVSAYTIYIIDAAGRNVGMRRMAPGQLVYDVPVGELSNGMYVLKLVRTDRVSHLQFLIQK